MKEGAAASPLRVVAPSPDEFTQAIAEAETHLTEAEDSLPRHDELRIVIGSFRKLVGLFPRLASRLDRAADRAATPLSPEQQKSLAQLVSQAAVAGATSGAAAGTTHTVARLARAVGRRTAAGVGIVVALSGLLCGAGGYYAGRASVMSDLADTRAGLTVSLRAGQAWLPLMRANPDPAAAIAQAQTWTESGTGRHAAAVPLYLDDDVRPPGKH